MNRDRYHEKHQQDAGRDQCACAVRVRRNKRARRRQLDLGFVEQLLPNTLGVRHFGYTNSFVMNPFACRRLIHLAMQIPPELRMADRPNEMLLARNCADLTDIPFEREVAGGAELPEPAAEPEAMPAKRRARA